MIRIKLIPERREAEEVSSFQLPSQVEMIVGYLEYQLGEMEQGRHTGHLIWPGFLLALSVSVELPTFYLSSLTTWKKGQKSGYKHVNFTVTVSSETFFSPQEDLSICCNIIEVTITWFCT